MIGGMKIDGLRLFCGVNSLPYMPIEYENFVKLLTTVGIGSQSGFQVGIIVFGFAASITVFKRVIDYFF